MNENNIPVFSEVSVRTTVAETSNTNDIIDLTETDGSEETSDSPVTQPGSLSRNRRRTNSSKAQSEPTDDSICILYEKIQPPPEIQVLNEVIIDDREHDQSTNSDPFSMYSRPGALDFLSDFHQIPTIIPGNSSERTSCPLQPINYSMVSHTTATQLSSLPSCKYASVINERPSQQPFMSHIGLQTVPRPSREVPLNLKTVHSNPPSFSKPPSQANPGSTIENSIITVSKSSKVQCGICLDGIDEISESNRRFMSTNCGHVFCDTCLKNSMRSQAKCPKCRKKITTKTVHVIYF